MLEQMRTRLEAQQTFESAVNTALDDVIALHGAEYGDLQLPVGNHLVIVAARGLSADFLRTFRWVSKNSGCTCGRALRLGHPVIVADVEKDKDYASFHAIAKIAKYRGVQSTPLFSTAGAFCGMISTLFVNVHEPTPIEMATLKSYSRIVADHLVRLLAGNDIAVLAARMSDALYLQFA
jgi:hypothetical protein